MKFSVGELVILQNATYFSEWNGAIGEVLGAQQLRNCMDMHSMKTEWLQRYSVLPLVDDGFRVFCSESQLRKLNRSRSVASEVARSAGCRPAQCDS